MNKSLYKRSYVYHYTRVSNLAKILKDGIQPTDTYRDPLEQELATVADAYDIDYPIDRSECVFFYPWIPHPSTERRFETDAGKLTLGTRREGIIVVDAELVENDLYVADFKLFSDAIDFQYMSEPDGAMVSESKEDALRRYAETVTRIESFERLDQICSRFHLPEVVFEGAVPPDAIMSCVLNDKFFTRLLM